MAQKNRWHHGGAVDLRSLGVSLRRLDQALNDAVVYDDALSVSATGSWFVSSLAATTLSLSSSLTLGGTLTVSGATTLKGALSVGGATVLSSNLTVGGTLTVSGTTTLKGNVSVSATTVVIGNPTTATIATLDAPAGSVSRLTLRTGTSDRWRFERTATAESGADAGSNAQLIACTDAGVAIDVPVVITRAALGVIELRRPLRLLDAISVSAAATLQGTLTVSGAATFKGTISTSAGATIGGTLSVSAAATFKDAISVAGNAAVGTARSTDATTGFLYIPSCPGTPTGTPVSVTGAIPVIVDSTNNKLYFYSGGAWRDAGP